MISLHLRGAKLMISIHLRGAKLYDPLPLRVQIYLGRFFKRSFLYGVEQIKNIYIEFFFFVFCNEAPTMWHGV